MSEAAVMFRGNGALAALKRLPAGLPLREPVLQGPVLGRLGAFEVVLAASSADIRLAQALRYKVFHEGRGHRGTLRARLTRRDEDRFDRFCDHLLLVDRTPGKGAGIAGTYRLLSPEAAGRAGRFYGQSEFDVAGLVARHPGRRFLELGRSCILPEYRGRRTMELLWHGIWAYMLSRRIDVLFGCASLPGTSVEALAAPLGFLKANAVTPAEWHVDPAPGRGVPLPGGSVGGSLADAASLPPLIKAYLRVGGMVSAHAVVDHAFATTDVFLILPLERIAPRYVAHYGAAAERFG